MSKQKPPIKKIALIPVVKGRAQIKTSPVISSKTSILLALAAVLLLTLVSYFPCLNNGFTNWDDPDYVTDNPMLPNDKPADYFGKDKFSMGLYQPLTMLSFATEYHISKLNPARYHIDNLVLHLLNTALLFFLILLLIGHWQGAAIAAALFGVHPMHVESVAWVTERKDVLYTFFYLASLIAYIFYVHNKKPLLYAGTMALFVLSLLSKGQAVTLPLSMLLIDYFCNRKITAKTLIEKTPFLILALLFGITAIVSEQYAINSIHTRVGFGFNTFLYAFYGIAFYLFKFILPFQLSCFYPYPLTSNGFLPVIFYLAPLIVLGIIAWGYFKFHKNKSIVFGSLFFLLNIDPVLQLIPIGGFITADRFTYIPYIGLCFIVAQVVMFFFGYNITDGLVLGKFTRKPAPYKNAALIAATLAIAVFAYAGNERCRVWKNSKTLFTNAIENYPEAAFAYNNLALAYIDEGKDLSAQHEYSQAKPLIQTGVNNLKKCCEIEPNYFDGLRNLGLGYAILGKYDSSIHYLSEAIRVQPQNSEIWLNRSITYRSKGQTDSALADISRAIVLAPDSATYYNSRANIYFAKGMFRDAITDYQTAINKDPKSVLLNNNLGHCYNKLGIYDSAIFYYNKVLARYPDREGTYVFRGVAYAGKLDYKEAIKDYTKGVNLNSNDAQAYWMRSQAFLATNDKKSALADALQAKKLGFKVPDNYLTKLGNE